MIYTGYYGKLNYYRSQGLTPIAISGKKPNFYEGLHWKFFAPSWDIFSKWKSGEINNEEYTERFISERLGVLDKKFLKYMLESTTNPILLCYEKEGFCHRHLVAEWIQKELNLDCQEYPNG